MQKALCLAYDARGLCPLHHEVLNGGVATETAESLKRIQSKSGEWPRTQRGDNMLMLAAKCDRVGTRGRTHYVMLDVIEKIWGYE